jgi:hypothetical protein
MNENTKKLLGATATPLASIFGSGFLVIVPILNGNELGSDHGERLTIKDVC